MILLKDNADSTVKDIKKELRISPGKKTELRIFTGLSPIIGGVQSLHIFSVAAIVRNSTGESSILRHAAFARMF